MLVKTKFFGEIDLSEDKIITFERGIIGFENCKQFTILFDSDKEERPVISWLQSLEEQALALPIINPLVVKDDYNPIVEDELLKHVGDLTEENLVIFLAMTVPSDLTKMTVNLKAPFIINADTRQGAQLIVENQDYEVRYKVYEVLNRKKGAE